MPMATRTKNLMMLYVRDRLFKGLEPDEDGYYRIHKSEFIRNIPMSESNFMRIRNAWIEYDLSAYSISCAFNFKISLKEDHMFLDVSYNKGYIQFKRNPVTYLEEISGAWTRSVGGYDMVHSIYQYIPPLTLPDGYVLPKKYRYK